MLARRLANHVSHVTTRGSLHSPKFKLEQRRSLSWTNAQQSSRVSPIFPSGATQSVTDELDRIAPRIDILAKDIEVLREPKDFYRTLKSKILNAKQRIFFATLYIGRTEDDLIDCIRQSLRSNSELKVSILTDALRGTRESPHPSCASLLSTLAAEFPSQVEIRMYHTPNLIGIRKWLLPRRLNEGWGLQHMKLYGVDDEVILSGANLSDDYFTNRQDRYHVFSSKKVTDYFAQVHRLLSLTSFVLQPCQAKGSYEMIWPEDNPCPSPLVEPNSFVEVSRKLLEPLSRPNESSSPPASSDTASVFPVMVIPGAVNTELSAMRIILDVSQRQPTSVVFTAGYFNPDPAIIKALLESAVTNNATTIITASPWANGFYGSKGVSGMLPSAYTLLARRFLQKASRAAPGAVELKEWRLGTVGRPQGWTYHAKGIWLSYGGQCRDSTHQIPNDDDEGPAVTVIGSSNYTVRSYSLDTEVGAVVVTRDPSLRQRYLLETKRLLEHSKTVSERELAGGERRVGLGVRVCMWIVQAVGGSL